MGRKLCDHRLSAAPSQPYQRCPRRFIKVGVVGSTSATPTPRRRLSFQLRSGTWQLAQAFLPLPERRGSKNRSVPRTMASAFPDTRLEGSRGTGAGHGPWDRMIVSSLSVNGTRSSATLVPGRAAPAATARATAMRNASRVARVNPEISIAGTPWELQRAPQAESFFPIPSGPDSARHLDHPLQLAALVIPGDQIAELHRGEAALGRDGQALDRDVLGRLVDPPAQEVDRLERRDLRADEPQRDHLVAGQEAQRLEPACPLGVVLQQEAVDVELAECLLGHDLVAAFGVPAT